MNRQSRKDISQEDRSAELKRLFAELLGTFALTTVDAGGAVIAAISQGDVTPVARSLATGLVIMALIYAIGNVSGAHFNPAVTFGFAVRGVFPWSRLPGYWIAQLLGAVLAALFLRTVFGPVEHLGATLPHYGVVPAFVIEVFLTWLLLIVILGTATRHKVVGANAALAAGGTVALDSLFARPISGASMNPARSLGPALVSAMMGDVWIYVLAPLLGAVIAVFCMEILRTHKQPSEIEAATGKGDDPE